MDPRTSKDLTARTMVARARTVSPDGSGAITASSLPLPIQALVGGAAATILLIVTAIAVRAPLPDLDPGPGPKHKAATTTAASTAAGASSPSATAEPTSALPAAAPPLPPDFPPIQSAAAREVTLRFTHLMRQATQFDTCVNTLAELLAVDPGAPARKEVRPLIVKLAQRVMLVKNSDAPERFFALVVNQMGPTGIDILFELETTKGSSLGAARASEFLRDPAIRRRGTAALQIAYEVRHTRSCEQLLPLLDRAQADGDSRTFGQLMLLGRLCGRRDSDCCLNDQRFKDTTSALRKRAGR